MEMHQVRYFLAVCAERNFTRAARRCGIAQPSLTKAIKLLEAELGGMLFQRSSRRTDLSALGTTLYPHFLRIERSAAGLRTAATLHQQSRQSNLRELSVHKALLKGVALLLPILAIGVIIEALMLPRIIHSEPGAAVTLDPYEMHLAVDMTALPVQTVHEPF